MADISYAWNDTEYINNLPEADNVELDGRTRRKTIIIKCLIAVIVLALIIELVFYALILPSKSIALIKVSGCTDISSLEIKKIAGLTGKEKWMAINSSLISQRLISNPLISSVTVQKKFPDKVLINVVERKAVAIAFANINNKTIPMEIDKYGVVFRIGNIALGKNLPIITGLTFNNPVPGMKINSQLSSLFMQLELLKNKESLLLNEISEIKIKTKKYGGYELLIYPIKSKLSILTNKTLTEDSLRYMILLLDVVKDIGLDNEIVQIDIRGSNAVYKKRGALDE